jgi:hypothetical protein
MNTARKTLIKQIHRLGKVPARKVIAAVRGIERGVSGPFATMVWLTVWPALFLG